MRQTNLDENQFAFFDDDARGKRITLHANDVLAGHQIAHRKIFADLVIGIHGGIPVAAVRFRRKARAFAGRRRNRHDCAAQKIATKIGNAPGKRAAPGEWRHPQNRIACVRVIVCAKPDFKVDVRSQRNTARANFADQIAALDHVTFRHADFTQMSVERKNLLPVVRLCKLQNDYFAVVTAGVRRKIAPAHFGPIVAAHRDGVLPRNDNRAVGDGVQRRADWIFKFLTMMHVKVAEPGRAVQINRRGPKPLRRRLHRPSEQKMLHDRRRRAGWRSIRGRDRWRRKRRRA